MRPANEVSMSYEKNDPKGWGGDPSRGAALGRRDITPAPPVGTVTVQEIRVDSDGYDPLGTYWGVGVPLFYVEGETVDGEEWEMTIRASTFREVRDAITAAHPTCIIKRVSSLRRAAKKES